MTCSAAASPALRTVISKPDSSEPDAAAHRLSGDHEIGLGVGRLGGDGCGVGSGSGAASGVNAYVALLSCETSRLVLHVARAAGKRVKVRRRHGRLRGGRPAGSTRRKVTVRIVARTKSGRTLRDKRVYHLCAGA
jgi:hypothetical protein